jgi:hypothetical protein
MRDLTKSDRNKLVINDTRSGTEIELYYRNPTTQEEIEYQSKLIKRKGKKVLINAFETRLQMGLKILTGFREGDFGVDGKPISSDPSSPNYREDWKDLLKEYAADIVTAFAFAVFEGARINTDIGLEIDFVEEIEEVPPLSKNLKDSETDAQRLTGSNA